MDQTVAPEDDCEGVGITRLQFLHDLVIVPTEQVYISTVRFFARRWPWNAHAPAKDATLYHRKDKGTRGEIYILGVGQTGDVGANTKND